MGELLELARIEEGVSGERKHVDVDVDDLVLEEVSRVRATPASWPAWSATCSTTRRATPAPR